MCFICILHSYTYIYVVEPIICFKLTIITYKHRDRYVMSQARFRLARFYIEAGDGVEAERALTEVVNMRQGGDFIEAQLALLEVYLQNGRYDEAHVTAGTLISLVAREEEGEERRWGVHARISELMGRD